MLEWLAIGLGTSLLILAMLQFHVTERADRLIYDSLSPLYAAPPDDRVLIVRIDDTALKRIGQWPWPRTVHARAIDQISKSGASAILYDVLFIEPSAQDAALARSMRAGPAVFLPLLFDVPGTNGAPYDMYRPVEPIGSAASGLGSANLVADNDGQIRQIEIATTTPQGMIPHVSELATRRLIGHPSRAFTQASKDGQPLYVPFNPNGSFRTVDFASLAEGQVPHVFLTNKIVIVGASATGLGDSHAISTAGGGLMPGIEVQANLISALLADRFIHVAPQWGVATLSLLPLWTLLLAFWRFRPGRNITLALLMMGAVLVGAALMLAIAGMWIPPTAALLGVVLVYPLWGWRRLSAISAFLITEVDALSQQPGMPALPTPTSARWVGDPVAGDAQRLHDVIGLMRHAAQEREEMLQFLSHDMRAPQVAIIALTDDSQRGRPISDLAASIRRYARHTLRLADDFVQLARLQSQTAHPFAEPLDLVDAMAQATDLVWPQAQARGIHIHRREDDLALGDYWTTGDGAALVRAFTNLLDNAVRHSPKGGTVRWSMKREGSDALCTISDAGPGLPQERRTDPFARFGSSSQDGTGGSGLGLAYVKAVARFHGGDIDYADSPDGGATFTLRLPVDREAAEGSG